MFIKKKNYKLLDKSIEDLSSTLEKANIKEIMGLEWYLSK